MTRRQPTRRAVVIGLAASGCAPAMAPAAEAASSSSLVAFHAALRATQGGGTANVLQFGDSHTANDSFSGRLRELFQARFGDAGRGMLPPGIPHDWYRPNGVSVTAEGWQPLPGPGLAPLRQRAAGRATMVVTGTAPGACARLGLDVLPAPGAGTVLLRFDTGQTATVPTALSPHFDIAAPGAAAVTLTTAGDGPVDLLGLTLLNGRPGVTWSNLGLPGATVALTSRWDPAIAAAAAAALRPSLLVLAFGTNEAFKDATDLAEYRTLFASRLRAMRALAPTASCMVVLPPPGLRRAPPAAPTGQPCGDSWFVPPNLGPVRAIQADAAAASGAASWDWSAAAGGACVMPRLIRSGEAAADGVHFLRPGYRMAADHLFGTLTAGLG